MEGKQKHWRQWEWWGRPLLFKSEKELQKKIDEYFKYCDTWKTKQIASKGVNWVVNTIRQPIPYTVSWLASFLGTNRTTLINYTNKEKYFNTIKGAKEKIEANMEENALMWNSNSTVSIFSFKNNFGWVDKTETEHSGEIKQSIVYLPKKEWQK